MSQEPPFDSRGDRDLLACFVADGRQEAFAALVRRHGDMVLRVCRARLGNAADAEDAAQAVFLTLARRSSSLTRHETLAGWLYRVAWYVAGNAAKVRQTRLRHEQEAARMGQPANNPASDLPIPPEALYSGLFALAEKYRLPLILHHLQGKTESETAALLGISVSAASARLARGRQKLRSQLARLGAASTLASTVALTAALSEPASAVPAAFVTAATQTAASALAGQVVTGSILSLSQGAIHMLFMAKMKLAAMVTAAVLLLMGGVLVARPWRSAPGPQPVLRAAAIPDPLARANLLVFEGEPGGPAVVPFDPNEAPPYLLGQLGQARNQFRFKPGGGFLSTQGDIIAVAFSPDGKHLASLARSEEARVWDVRGAKVIVAIPRGVSRLPSWIAFSAGGKEIVYNTEMPDHSPAVLLADALTGRVLRQVGLKELGEGAIGPTAAFSPSAQMVAAGTDPAGILLADLHRNRPARTCAFDVQDTAQGGTLIHMSFSADGRYLAAASWPKSVVIFHTRSATRLGSVPQTAALFSPDSRLLAASSQATRIVLYETATLGQALEIEAVEPAKEGRMDDGFGQPSMAFSPDGRVLASGHINGSIRLWDTDSGQQIGELSGNRRRGVDQNNQPAEWPVQWSSLAFSPDGVVLASGGGTYVRLWDVQKAMADAKMERPAPPDRNQVTALVTQLEQHDAAEAHRAIGLLSRSPVLAVAELSRRIDRLLAQANQKLDETRVKQLIAALDDDRYAVREGATQSLRKLLERHGPALEALLRAAQKGPSGQEARGRIDTLFAQYARKPAHLLFEGPDGVLLCRSMHLLARLNTPESRAQLERIAQGTAGSRASLDVEAALRRLKAATSMPATGPAQ